MKKITKLLVLIIMLFGLGSCNLFQQNYYEDTKDITELKEEGRYQEVTFQEVKDMCKENKTFVFYVKLYLVHNATISKMKFLKC
jgi:hypothetical protein